MKNLTFASISLAAAVALAALTDGAAHAQQSVSRDSLTGVSIGVQGCVKAGIDKGSVVLSNVKEVGADRVARTPVPSGGPAAIYAFNESTKLLPYVGHNVEVHGRIKNVEDSKIEVKPAAERDGALVAELPGSGDGVRASLDEVPAAVGTSGRPTEVPAVVLRMHVESVTPIAGTCSPS